MRDITINDILKMLLSHIKLIIIVSLIAFLGAYIYADNFIPKKYSATSMICIRYDAASDAQEGTENDGTKMSSGAVTLSTNLANNCSVIFRYSKEIQDIVPAGYTVNIASVNESNILSLTVTGSDAETCAKTANNIANASPVVFSKYYYGGTAMPFGREARAPITHSSPNETRYAIFGFIGGLVISILVAIIIEIIDTTIKPDDDLYKIYEVPVFAEIIDFEVEGGAKGK